MSYLYLGDSNAVTEPMSYAEWAVRQAAEKQALAKKAAAGAGADTWFERILERATETVASVGPTIADILGAARPPETKVIVTKEARPEPAPQPTFARAGFLLPAVIIGGISLAALIAASRKR